jgi:hypothetical protein
VGFSSLTVRDEPGQRGEQVEDVALDAEKTGFF